MPGNIGISGNVTLNRFQHPIGGRTVIAAYFGYLLYGNLLFILAAYLYLFKIRKLIGFQLGMNISIMAGGFIAIATGVILIYQFPFQFVFVTFASTIVGMLVGGLFGALFDYQTMLTGYSNGLMMGIMAPMVGAAAKNSMLFLGFIEVVLVISICLIISSGRSS